jgi:hypothetical protein
MKTISKRCTVRKQTRRIKFLAQALLVIAFSGAPSAQAAQQVVVPNNLANTEGNSSANDFLTSQSFRMQMVIDASQFSSLSSSPNVTNILSSIWFRIDGASGDGAFSGFSGASITLSVTSRSADNLSPIFAENVGGNPVTVFGGGLQFGQGYIPGASPQPFALSVVAGANRFYYSPTQGNLLVDIVAGGGLVIVPGALDAQFATDDGASRVFANAAGATSGTIDTLGLATRFDFVVVPEPSVVLLIVFGVAAVAVFRRR